MSYTNEHIILKKLSRNPAEEASVDELIEITSKYPAFGAGKYLLAKKMQQQGNEGFHQQAKNAVLYFASPFWFHFKLNEESLMGNPFFLPKNETPLNPALGEVVEPPTQTVADSTTETELNPTIAVEITPEQPVTEIDEMSVSAGAGQLAEETIATGDSGIKPVEEPKDIEAVDVITTPAYEEAVHTEPVEEPKDIEAVELITPPAYEEAAHTDAIVVETPLDEVGLEAQPVISQPQTAAAVVGVAANTQAEGYVADRAAFAEMATAPEDVADDTGAVEAEEALPMPALNNEKISAILDEQLAEYKKPVTEETPVPIESEPYHTIDYFASQGIKLTREQQSQDHLSVKVKKFTDWLKQMKRINPQPADLGIDEIAESKVQHIAEGSNETKDVVTEAMAEVLAKQGMNEKAIQVYAKLSFLYPDKSAYFATQIEHLKEK